MFAVRFPVLTRNSLVVRLALVLVMLLAMAQAAPAQAYFTAPQHLVFGAAGDLFGTSVAVSGNYAVVGAPSYDFPGANNAGAVHVYEYSGGTWNLLQTLSAGADRAQNDGFGTSVAINGNIIVAGAPKDDHSGVMDLGSAYAFVRAAGSATWPAVYTAKLLPNPLGIKADQFGNAAAVSGNTVMIGSALGDPGKNEGAAYFYDYNPAGGTFSAGTRIAPDDGALQDRFGTSVDISGDTAVVGAPNHVNGKVYVFTRSGGVWTQTQALTPATLAGGDTFGAAVAIDGGLLAAGAPGADPAGLLGAGAAYAFTWNGAAWVEAPRLTAAGGKAGDAFGGAVSASLNTVAVGAAGYDLYDGTGTTLLYTDEGAAYIFDRNATGPDTWGQTDVLLPSVDGNATGFGRSLSVDANTVIVGAGTEDQGAVVDQGGAYVYQVNFNPVVDLSGPGSAGIDFALSYTENDGWVNLTSQTLTITDQDSTMLYGASVTITNPLDGAAEELRATGTAAIPIISYASGVLTLNITTPVTLADVEQVLSTVQYRNTSENPNTSLPRTVQFVVSDGAFTNMPPAVSTVTITAVNDPPAEVNMVSGGSVDENYPVPVQVAAFSTTDPDSFTFTYSLDTTSLGCDNPGNFYFVGAQLWSDLPRDYETTPSFNLCVTSSDGQYSITRPFTITVNNLNEPPILTVPAAQVITEDTPLVLSGAAKISVADPDAGTADLRFTLSVDNGSLTLATVAGLDFTAPGFGDGTADAAMSFTGSLAGINAALNGLTFNAPGNFNGPVTLSLQVNDLGHTGSGIPRTDSDTLAITVTAVNDAPVLTGPAAQIPALEDAVVTLDGANLVSVSDVDAGSGLMRATLTAAHGTLTLATTAGLDFTAPGYGDGTDDAAMSFTATLANINAALDGMTFDPAADYVGLATVAATVSDEGNTGTGGPLDDNLTVTINYSAVNDAPRALNLSNADVDEDTPGALLVGVLSTVDPDQGDTFTYTLTTGAGCPGTDNALFAVVGSNLNTGPGVTFDYETRTSYAICLEVKDSGNLTYQKAFTITVNDLNDAPVVTAPVDVQVTDEDVALTLSGADTFAFADIDALTGAVRITLTAADGTLTLATTTGLDFSAPGFGDGTDDATMSFTGTLAAVNAAVDGLVFTPAANFNGMTYIDATINDQTASYPNGALSATGSIDVQVNPVIDTSVTAVASTSPNPSQVGSYYRVSFAVTSAAGTPDGSVTVTVLKDNVEVATCTGVLSGGTGSCWVLGSEMGDYTLVAHYEGSADFDPSDSAPVTHTVGKAYYYMPIMRKD